MVSELELRMFCSIYCTLLQRLESKIFIYDELQNLLDEAIGNKLKVDQRDLKALVQNKKLLDPLVSDIILSFRKLSDVLKRKKAPKRSLGRKSKEEATTSETKPASRSSGRAKSASSKESKSSSSSKISFLPSLNPRSWAKFSSSDRVPKASASKVG